MANLGKKILSAFVEVNDDKKPQMEAVPTSSSTTVDNSYTTAINSSKFKDYFENWFSQANLPGPDYFEYCKMVEAMRSLPDEKTRFTTAFVGLCVQGLDKQTLLSTAAQYLQLLETDARHFQDSVDATMQEKVVAKKQQANEKEKRIQQLMQEISALQTDLLNLQAEIKENEAKIEVNTVGYKYESEVMKNRIAQDIEKIKLYIQ